MKRRVWICSLLMWLPCISLPSYSQLQLGVVQNVTQDNTCPSMFAPSMTCYHATVSNCANTQDNFALDFGYVPGTAPLQGTIVLLAGSGGTNPDQSPERENDFVSHYSANGY